MSCLKSFSFISAANENAVPPEIKTWGPGSDLNWLFQSSNPNSTFLIEGFKNVNIHSIQAVGTVSTLLGAVPPSSMIVTDWAFSVRINGQNPLISGSIQAAPNGFSIQSQPINPTIELSRYNPSYTFANPIQSATSIDLTRLQASGTGAEAAANINIAWFITFIIFYTYEGE
jgi:hypothetical protein